MQTKMNQTFNLLPGERIITQSDKEIITLTNHRICEQQTGMLGNRNQTISLNDIVSITQRKLGFWGLLVAFAVIIGFGIFEDDIVEPELIKFIFIISVVPLILFFLTQRIVVVIASASGKITIYFNRTKSAQAAEFVNKVEQAKHEFLVNKK
jgi:hypothetical protein